MKTSPSDMLVSTYLSVNTGITSKEDYKNFAPFNVSVAACCGSRAYDKYAKKKDTTIMFMKDLSDSGYGIAITNVDISDLKFPPEFQMDKVETKNGPIWVVNEIKTTPSTTRQP